MQREEGNETHNSSSMKNQFHIRGLSVNAGLRRWLEQSLDRLESLIPVTAAAVVLEHRRDDAPAFRAYVSLAVPGPDIHAEACDHTLEAAWLKVVTALRKQIERRKTRQQLGAMATASIRSRAATGLARWWVDGFEANQISVSTSLEQSSEQRSQHEE